MPFWHQWFELETDRFIENKEQSAMDFNISLEQIVIIAVTSVFGGYILFWIMKRSLPKKLTAEQKQQRERLLKKLNLGKIGSSKKPKQGKSKKHSTSKSSRHKSKMAKTI